MIKLLGITVLIMIAIFLMGLAGVFKPYGQQKNVSNEVIYIGH